LSSLDLSSPASVWVLQHVRENETGENVKFIGIYSEEHLGLAVIEKLKGLPGFKDHPEGFSLECIRVNETGWSEGFG